MRNLPEWPIAFFSITAIGAICVPLNAWWTGSELVYALCDSASGTLICDDERYERLKPHLDAVEELDRSEEHTSELQSLMRISYAVFCLKKKTQTNKDTNE